MFSIVSGHQLNGNCPRFSRATHLTDARQDINKKFHHPCSRPLSFSLVFYVLVQTRWKGTVHCVRVCVTRLTRHMFKDLMMMKWLNQIECQETANTLESTPTIDWFAKEGEKEDLRVSFVYRCWKIFCMITSPLHTHTSSIHWCSTYQSGYSNCQIGSNQMNTRSNDLAPSNLPTCLNLVTDGSQSNRTMRSCFISHTFLARSNSIEAVEAAERK